MTGTIIGNQNPLVGTTYTYEIKPSGLSFGLKGDYEWYLFKKQKNGSWKDITGKPKTGEKVTYNFGEIALGIEFQMKVYETKKRYFTWSSLYQRTGWKLCINTNKQQSSED